ncbi:MAG TPA: protein kinase [Candidatus Obscuribacterales bacterium]
MNKTCPTCNKRFEDARELTKCPDDDTFLAAEETDPHIGQVLGGKYRLLAPLGKGGMGTVYQAELTDATARPDVAVKLLHKHLISEPVAVKRFQRECQAASTVKHPAIASVIDYGVTEDGQPYLVMEKVEGKTLAAWLTEHSRLPVEGVRDIAVQVLAALSVAHEQGIIHRDLKPGNIMLQPNNGGGFHIKLLDFGIAKVLPRQGETFMRMTMVGDMCGSVAYMSPEQCLEQDLDARSDIYSLGCVLYEAASGSPAMAARTAFETMNKHLSNLPLPLSQIVPDIPKGTKLERIIFKALSKKPEERYQTAAEMAQEFEAPAELIVAPPPALPSKRKLSLPAISPMPVMLGAVLAMFVAMFLPYIVVTIINPVSVHTASSAYFLSLALMFVIVGMTLVCVSLYIFGPDGYMNRLLRDQYVPSRLRNAHFKEVALLSQKPGPGDWTLGNFIGGLSKQKLYLKESVRRERPHVLIVGTKGSGKSTLMASMVSDEIKSGTRPVLAIDTTGSMTSMLREWSVVNPLQDGSERLMFCQAPELPEPQALLKGNKVVVAQLSGTCHDKAAVDEGRELIQQFASALKAAKSAGNPFNTAIFIDDFPPVFEDELFDRIASLAPDVVVSLQSLQAVDYATRNRIIAAFGTVCAFSLIQADAALLAPLMFRVEGRRVKQQKIGSTLGGTHFELVVDEERLNVERLMGQPTANFYCYRMGTEAGIFRLATPIFPPETISF